MSSDNGIYIGQFPNGEFRVIHASAIDNLNYEPDGDDGFNSVQVINYFDTGAAVFGKKEQSMVYAHSLAEGCDILEYGICTIYFPSTMTQFKSRANNCTKGNM